MFQLVTEEGIESWYW